MKTTMTAKDAMLIRISGVALVFVLMARFSVMPQIDKRKQAQATLEATQAAVAQVEERVARANDLAKGLKAKREKVYKLAKPYYDMMENRKVDELVTGIVLEHDLFPISLSIAQGGYGIPNPFIFSEGGVSDAASLLAQETAQETEKRRVNPWEALAANAEQAALEASGVVTPAPASPELQSTLFAVDTSLSVSGARADVMNFIGDITDNYPAIRIKTIQLSGETYMGPDMNPGEKTSLQCVLTVYMKRDWMKG